MFRTDDPLRDFSEKCREEEEWLKSRPICAECGEPIQDEVATCINGTWYCDECMKAFRRYTDTDVA